MIVAPSKTLFLSTAILLSSGLSLPTMAQDLEEGRELVEADCTRCHGSEVYTRADHRVSSLAGLQSQVQRCVTMTNLQWFDDQVESVVHYLDKSYYKF